MNSFRNDNWHFRAGIEPSGKRFEVLYDDGACRSGEQVEGTMTGKINEIHDTEPIGTIRVALNRAISGAQCVMVELLWPPVERVM